MVGSIRAQTIEMFEYRGKKAHPTATAAQKRQAQESKRNSPAKKIRRNSSPDSGEKSSSASGTIHDLITSGVVLRDDGARSDTSAYSPSKNSTPEPERSSRPQTIDGAPRQLIVKLRHPGCFQCSDCSRPKFIVSRMQEHELGSTDIDRCSVSETRRTAFLTSNKSPTPLQHSQKSEPLSNPMTSQDVVYPQPQRSRL